MNRNDAAVLETIRDAVGKAAAGTVFGEPVSLEGITMVPAAKISGGGGGGGGEGPAPAGASQEQLTGAGTGGGFGLAAKPAGAFVIKKGKVAWRPAVDVNRIIIGAQVVAIVAMVTARAIAKARIALVENGRGRRGRRRP